jgi:hypothetical protein
LFKEIDIVNLAKLLLSREDLSEGWLLSNCLYSLNDKNAIISNNKEFANELIHQAITKPLFGLLNILYDVFDEKFKKMIKSEIDSSLDENFNYKLYYNAVISNTISDPLKQLNSYLDFFKSIENNNNISNSYYKSPYTGINEPQCSSLNELVEVLITIDNKETLQNSTVQYIVNNYPYYNFVLNIENYKLGDDFNAYWILENQSDIILKKLSKNEHVKNSLHSFLLKKYDEKISKIYFKYFIN